MGISNDIRPKKKKETRPEPAPELVKEEEKIELEEGEEEVSINRVVPAADHFHAHFEDDDGLRTEAVDDFFGPYRHNEEEHREPPPPEKTRKTGSNLTSKVIIALLVIALIVILIQQNLASIYKYLGVDELIGSNQTEETITNPYENLSTDYTSKTIEPNSASSAAQQETSDTTQSATTQATTVTTLDKSSVKLSVLNGNGVSGSAASVKSALESAGYTVSNLSNAKLFSYQSTMVYYKTGKAEYAEDIKKSLSSRTVVLEESNTIAGAYDLVVVVGAK